MKSYQVLILQFFDTLSVKLENLFICQILKLSLTDGSLPVNLLDFLHQKFLVIVFKKLKQNF